MTSAGSRTCCTATLLCDEDPVYKQGGWSLEPRLHQRDGRVCARWVVLRAAATGANSPGGFAPKAKYT